MPKTVLPYSPKSIIRTLARNHRRTACRTGTRDYILRTMYVPAGQHTIEMRFDPTSLHVTEGIAYGALALLVIGIIVAVLIAKRKYVKA